MAKKKQPEEQAAVEPLGATTPSWLLPYPVSTDPADVPHDMQALANRLETVLTSIQNSVPAADSAGDLKWVGYPVAAGSEGTQCPGWLLCDGRAVSRTTYAALFTKLGTAYGAGDGSSTFNLPDGRGRGLIGAGTGTGLTARVLGAKGGEESHVISVGEMPSHDHGGKTAAGATATGTTGGGSTGTGTTGGGTTGTDSPDHSHSGTTGEPTFGSYHTVGWNRTTTMNNAGSANGVTGLVDNGGGNQNTTTTIETPPHMHNFSTGGASARHAHAIPGLAIPALSIPGLSIPALAVAGLNITAQGGGAGANVMQPFTVGNLLIKT